jgi:hypothetical protein
LSWLTSLSFLRANQRRKVHFGEFLHAFMFVTCKICLYQNLWKVWVKIPNSRFWCPYLLILFKCWG